MIKETLGTFLKEVSLCDAVSLHPNIYVAYSGGVDSHVLLHALVQLVSNKQLKVIHIHHGLFQQADEWAAHCQKICNKLKVDCEIVKVKVDCSSGDSIEEAARNARYQVFAKLLQDGDVLVCAHHVDDQAETCLLQFLRGAGIKGLAAMPSVVRFAKGYLARPFLSISRQDILTYAKQNKLSWVEDESNHDLKFTRNFLRYKVMPLFKKRWPGISKTIMRVSDHCAEANQLLKELAEQDLSLVHGKASNTLSVQKLNNFSYVRQKNILREWLQNQGYLLPSTIKLKHIIGDVINARGDAKSCVSWSDVEVRRYQDDVYAMDALVQHDVGTHIFWDCKKDLQLPANMGLLSCKKVVGKGVRQDVIKEPLKVAFRQGGEACRLLNRQGTHQLKKLFQEWQVPPWLRDRVPLIYIADKLAMIVGFGVCEEFAAREDERGVIIWCRG
jgi:tRNA(Ile)-lysidine synthase